MRKKRFGRRSACLWLVAVGGLMLWPSGCARPIDIRSIAEGQFISFINAIINTATSDAIRGGFSG